MTIERASDNPFPSVLMVEGDPEALAANPAAGQQRLAVDSGDHLLYLVDDAGVKTAVGGGGSSDLDAIITASSGQDIADALAGAAAPDAGNVFATMADVGGGGGDWIKLATTTLGADAADITFTGLSGAYRDLIASVNVRSTSGSLDNLFIRCGNGSIDTANHYAYNNTGSAGVTGALNTQIRAGIDTYSGLTAGVFASGEYTFYNYADTTLQKTIFGRLHFYDYTANVQHWEDVHAAWNQTSAIDQIRFYTSANLKAGSSITIYGRSI